MAKYQFTVYREVTQYAIITVETENTDEFEIEECAITNANKQDDLWHIKETHDMWAELNKETARS